MTVWWAIAVAALGVVAGRVTARRRGERAHRQRIARTVPVALDLLVLAAEAGFTPHQAIALVHRTGPTTMRDAFGAVLGRTERGESLADALGELPRRLGPAAVAATDALALAQRHGAPMRDALTVIAAEAARQRRAASDAAARRLPVLLSFPLVCCVLPAFVLLGLAPSVLAALRSITRSGW